MDICSMNAEQLGSTVSLIQKVLLVSLIAESAGKITSAEIRRDPTRFMESTMITAMITALKNMVASDTMPK